MSVGVPPWKKIVGWILFFALVLLVVRLRYHWFRELQTGWLEHLQDQ